jgi:hypothetical protein
MSTQPASGLLATLPAELFALLDGASIVHLATRNAALEPMSVFSIAVRVGPAGLPSEVTVFVPVALGDPVLTNLRDNGQMAVTMVSPADNHSVQLKGLWLGERRTDDEDRAYLARHHDQLMQVLGLAGVPRSIWRRVIWWPCLALRMEVRDAFVQTPGPGAGRRCEAAAGKS